MKVIKIIKKMRFKILSAAILFIICFSGNTYAQQDAQYSMYMFNTLAVNPAYAGTRDALTMTLLNRNQWIGYPGAPVTQTLTAHTPLFGNIGVGLNLLNDKIGPLRNTGLFIDLSYRIKFNRSNLSFGLKGGGDVIKGDLNSLNTTQSNDPSFNNNLRSGFLPNFGTGVYYYSEKYYLGLSIPRSLSNRFWEIKNPNSFSVSKQQMHYYLIGGMIFQVHEYIKFKPSFQSKFTSGAPLQVDVNASFLIKEKLYLGAFYRLKDAMGFMIQYNFTDQLRGALAWDQTVSNLRSYNNGSVELCVSYDFIFKKNNIKSPRYF
jgi:type IX secretion system PorP/SprF family membrane protein